MSLSIDGVIREDKVKKLEHPIFAKFKKHYCSQCGERLKILWITQVIYKDSPENEGKKLAFGFGRMTKRPITYIFAIFECISCQYKLSIHDQLMIEKSHVKPLQYDDYHQYLKTENLKK